MRPGMIGVAISTMNRFDMFRETLTHWAAHTPPEIPIVVVDDASDGHSNLARLEGWHGIDPVRLHQVTSTTGGLAVQHDYRRGIAMTKNRCITRLMDLGCEHLFLADDDVYPTVDQWWVPYVDSPERHLSYQWPRRGRRTPWAKEHDDGTHFSIGFPRGVMLYATREVIETVGGMDPAYGAHGGEHVDWAQRIHDAGLSSWRFADVCGSDNVWHAHDEVSNTNNSTYPLIDRVRMVKANALQWDKERETHYVEYREGVPGSQDYSLGVCLSNRPVGALDHVLGLRPSGVALEFGVGQGGSLRRIAAAMEFAYGFDSFAGLPEKWRDGFDAGTFACDPPDVPNTHLVIGQYRDTIGHFDLDQAGHIGLVHIDCDLYSSTKTVLDGLDHTKVFRPGTYVVFDEYHGYPGCQAHEQKAWREFADRTKISWTVIGHGPEQWAIRII